MITLQSPPHPELQDHIAQYLYASLENSNEIGSLRQKFFPIDIPCIAFYSKKLGISVNGHDIIGEARAIYSGLVKWGSSLCFPENISVWTFIVAFKPHGFAELFRLDSSSISDFTDFYSLPGAEGMTLHQQLEAAHDFNQQIQIADAYFLKKKPATDLSKPVREVCQEIIKRNGMVDIKALAGKVNLSLSSLERQFTRLVGVPPKQLARFKRFHYALKMLGTTDSSLTDIAYACDYYDQAHFIREFKKFTGTTPSSFHPEDYPFFYHFILCRNYYC